MRLRLGCTALCVGALVGGFAGCGGRAQSLPPETVDDDIVEGTRLKAPHWFAEDGYRHWDGSIYDSLFREPCEFAPTMDGKTRCTPRFVLGGNWLDDLFADPSCKERILGWKIDPGATRRFYGTIDPSHSCALRVDYREAGAPYTEGQLFRYARGVCTAEDPRPDIEYTREGPSISPGDFVAAEDVVVPRRGRLSEIHVRAEDGFTMRKGLFDTQAGVACSPDLTKDGTTRCVPTSRYVLFSSSGFVSDTCTGDRVATDVGCKDGKSELVRTASQPATTSWLSPSGSGECRGPSLLFEPGAPWPAQSAFAGTPGACTPDPTVAVPKVVVGPEIEADSFVLLDLVREGTTRLRGTRYVDGLGARLPVWVPWAFDSRLDDICAPNPGANGALGCAPTIARTNFTDASCTKAIALVERISSAPCVSYATKYALVDSRLHSLGARLEPLPATVYVTDQAGACKLSGTVAMIAEAYEFFSIGAEGADPATVTKSAY